MLKIFCSKKKAVAVWLVIALIITVCVSTAVVNSITAVGTGNGKTIVIDVGHGGRDGGVVGSTGIKEADVNLGISKSLKHFLKEDGYNVIMTRESDVDLAYGNEFKKTDMLARKRIIDSASPDLVVSIHQNSFPDKDVYGAQVFYAPSSDEGKRLAESMQTVLNANLSCSRMAKSGDYYIIQCSPHLSVLVECGFLSNPREESLLVTANYQRKVAYSIYSSIKSFLS